MESLQLVVPGEEIAKVNNGFMAGRGTYDLNGSIISTVVGKVATISKLVTVDPMKSPYTPETGDVIIGRIISVEKKHWLVNIFAQREGILNLTAINLPHCEQRIRGEEDAMQMRSFFKENDLLSGEVQQISQNGSIHIQTRNLKYGKLKNGVLIKVNHGLIKKKKHQFIELEENIKAILGMNGLVWVYYSTVKLEDEYFTDDKETIERVEKEEKMEERDAVLIILFKNIIEAIGRRGIEIRKEVIMRFYEIYMERKGKRIKEEGKEIKKMAKIEKELEREILERIIEEIANNELKENEKGKTAKKIISEINENEDEEMGD